MTLVRFTAKNGTLSAVFHLVNQATGQATNLTVPITQQERTTSCMILALTIDRIDRFSVGLHLQTTAIHIGLTAQSGTVLADVLCGLFPGRNPLKVLAAQLTAATHRGEITVT